MGMFDTLHAKCPNCGIFNEEQTKSGDRIFADIYADDVDSLQEAALFEGQVFACKCGTNYEVVNETKPRLVTRIVDTF